MDHHGFLDDDCTTLRFCEKTCETVRAADAASVSASVEVYVFYDC